MAFKWEDGSQCIGKLSLNWEDWGLGYSDDITVMVLDDRVMQEEHCL